MKWLLLIICFRGQSINTAIAHTTILKKFEIKGAVELREGVYILPYSEYHKIFFDQIKKEIKAHLGAANIITAEGKHFDNFIKMFDRECDYNNFLTDISMFQHELDHKQIHEPSEKILNFHHVYKTICTTDFFPGETRENAEKALKKTEAMIFRRHYQ